jgi:dGTPase
MQSNSSYRTCFQRDRARIIHSDGFRKLEYKTQLFVNGADEYYRTRLTHSLEVAQISRDIARYLKLDEDLAESIALAHDLGHTPFGHVGEHALDLANKDCCGFNHNVQAFRIVTMTEKCYLDFDGLNLTYETLEGIIQHEALPKQNPSYAYIFEFAEEHKLDINSMPSLESQVASIADEIAYINHDLEDVLRAELVTIYDIAELPIFNNAANNIKNFSHTVKNIDNLRLIKVMTSYVINYLINDLLNTTIKNIEKYKINNIDDVKKHDKYLVSLSDSTLASKSIIKKFFQDKIFSNVKIKQTSIKIHKIINRLYRLYFNEPEYLPTEWYQAIENEQDSIKKSRILCDYISGMTDQYAIRKYDQLFNINANIGLIT